MVKLYQAGDYYSVMAMAKSGEYTSRDLNIIGLAYYSTGKFDYATILFQEAERAFPNESFIKSNLGDALFASGQSGAALEKYREALAMSPYDQTFQERVVKAEREVARIYQRDHKGGANIQWDNARYGVPLENEGAQKRQESAARNNAADTSYPSRDMEEAARVERTARLEREAAIEKAARMEMTAKLEKERVEKERVEKEIPESVRLENNRKWLEREREDYRNRSF